MLRSILLGLDGSEFSHAAIGLGISLARETQALLVGLGVVDETAILASEAVPMGAAAFSAERARERIADAHRRVEQTLSSFSRQCAEQQVPSKVLSDVGAPGDRLALEAQRFDVILLGQHTYFEGDPNADPFETAQHLLKASPRPVLVTPRALRAGQTTVIGYDGSVQAARAVQALLATGLATWKPVHVVAVHPEHLEAARRADRVVEFLGAHGVKTVAHAIASSAAPAEVLQREAADLAAALVVVGAYGQSAWREFILGSATRTLLRQSEFPLFCYH